jgi:hypothetical protein
MATLDNLVELIGELEYGDQIPTAALELAKNIQAAIIYGYSDDSIMVSGVTEDQADAYKDKNVWVDKEGFLPINENQNCTDAGIETISDCRKLVKRFDQSVKLQVIEDQGGWLWQYKTDWPHRVFEMKEDGDPYCKGIVFLFPKS